MFNGRVGLKRADTNIQRVILYMSIFEMVHLEASHKLHVVNILPAFLVEK